jgi:hypothetical protein
MILRPAQRTTVDAAKVILSEKNVVYLACEVRTGKTIMALALAYEGTKQKYNKVCFLTKKKAIASIESDYEKSGYKFGRFTCTNYEQISKLDGDYDLYIADEAHSLGQFAKPSQRTKALRDMVGSKPVIFLSGSPHPECPAQIYHQFWVCQYGPFQKYANFYKWARDYVDVRKKMINGWPVNDYTHTYEDEIKLAIAPYMVHLSQKEAGFVSEVDEEIINVPIDNQMYLLMKRLKKDKIYTMKNGDVILADTPVRMQSLFHQLSSGTLNITKIENEKEVKTKYVLDESKAWYIKSRFSGQKIAIFYCFIAEGDLIRKIFPNHTSIPEEFNAREDLVFICQVISGREGINLSTADALVMYNIGFSATSYWQARARMQTKDRVKVSKLYWIFSERGLERHVYNAVSKKKNYTKSFFEKDIKMIA